MLISFVKKPGFQISHFFFRKRKSWETSLVGLKLGVSAKRFIIAETSVWKDIPSIPVCFYSEHMVRFFNKAYVFSNKGSKPFAATLASKLEQFETSFRF